MYSKLLTNFQEIRMLKEDSESAKKLAEQMEASYHDSQAKLELTKLELDDAVQKAQRLEKQLKVAQAANLANASSPISKQMSSKKLASQHRVIFLLFWFLSYEGKERLGERFNTGRG